MSRIVITGGTRSGKSERAEARAARSASVVYVATGRAGDPEMAERVAAHRDRRPGSWTVLERRDLGAVLAEVPDDATVLIDDLEGWLADRMGATGLWTDEDVAPLGPGGAESRQRVLAEAARWWATAGARAGDTIVVAGQPGWGITPMTASSRRWLDLHGDVLRALADAADETEVVIAGRAVALPPARSATPPHTAAGGPTERDRLREHGDTQVPHGTVDLAVNVLDGPPGFLRAALVQGIDDLRTYPAPAEARAAAAARHGRPPEECLLLNGAAEGFWLLARALRPRLAACIHPSFTEAEAALRAEGVPVVRVLRERSSGWRLDPAAVPDAADLVVLGRPDNPTGVADPVGTVAALCRPGRTVVVDEAFAELLEDAGGLADRRDLPGLIALRSLTKIWGIAGLRVGYLVAAPTTVAQLEARRQPWSVNDLALRAVVACTSAGAEEERRRRASAVAADRDHLLGRLAALREVEAWPSAASFVLLRTERPDLRERLLEAGLAVRRGDTFPGLDATYVRVAVRDRATTDRLATAIDRILTAPPGDRS